jgi:isoleucyl-tRNA synthetase
VYVPGWDCHGLPIEIKALEAEREKRVDGEPEGVLDAIGIRRAARALASKTVEEQMKGFREWGIMADWTSAWKTMDKSFEIAQLGVFQKMVKKGLIFRRYKPVYWSPSSRTALAEAELEYKDDHESQAAYVRFPLATVPQALSEQLGMEKGERLEAVIWTTTPWTLPANRAIAVNSGLEYAAVKDGSSYLLVESSRLAKLPKLFLGDSDNEVVIGISGSEIEGAQYFNPLRGKEGELQPVIHADFVSAESGSGLVHLAPGHGMDDYDVCTKLGIKADAPVNDLGCFTAAALPDDPEVLEGVSVVEGGSKAVLDILGDKVLHVHKYTHKYPYDWRTKLPVIIRATEQWFADVGHEKRAALEAMEKVRFIPESSRARLQSFIKSRSEWCISRQRSWGVPVPALYNENGVAVLTDESISHIIQVINERGIDAWWTDPADDPAWILPGLEGTYTRGKDTMDVWFDSGSSWTQTEQQADVYLEGTDQHRGWFQSSLLTYVSASDQERAPFKTLITHGFTLDQDGKKMSKSIGNTISPSQIMDGSLLPPVRPPSPSIFSCAVEANVSQLPSQPKKKAGIDYKYLGPDILRLLVASADTGSDVQVGPRFVQSTHTALVKCRNLLKMLVGCLHVSSRTAPLSKLDRIAIVQLRKVMSEVETRYDKYDFPAAISAINRWIHTDVSAFYLEAAKDRLYCGDGGGVVEELFHGLLRMLTPVTPNLVEEVWEHRPEWMKADEGLLHPLQRTPDDPIISPSRGEVDEHLLDDLPWLMNALAAVKGALEQARNQKTIGSSLQSAVVLQLPNTKAKEVFDRFAGELETIFVVSSVEVGLLEGSELEASEWKFESSFDAPGGRKGIVTILPPNGGKCPRCWRYAAEEDNKLCGRCHDALDVDLYMKVAQG